MTKLVVANEWQIIQDKFNDQHNELFESLCAIGNGRFGQRANFEEDFSGKTLQGNYVAGIYFPDKTRVGWWKNGYPDYFAKIINATNWIGIKLSIDGKNIDLNNAKIIAFERILDMQKGTLTRKVAIDMGKKRTVEIQSTRFCSMDNDLLAAIQYSVKPNYEAKITLIPYLDGNTKNQDANYGETFWEQVQQTNQTLTVQTKENPFKTPQWQVCTAMALELNIDGTKQTTDPKTAQKDKYIEQTLTVDAQKNQTIGLVKYIAIASSHQHNEENDKLFQIAQKNIDKAQETGFQTLLKNHINAWAKKWEQADIAIEGDIEAQQGIRFNIFQLYCTYTGEDQSLNIGPKGFTGEKYGGLTYWDTEAYCLPFYLATTKSHIARNLLIYRYKHLQKAIENAQKLGFSGGAALYPMVTINGEECHNEWEITFEEIHRNGAIAYAIFDYVRYTNDEHYLVEYGLEVLIALSRFWGQRVNWSSEKNQYVILGVTGPNEYENNVNNNFYTNKIATWTLGYTMYALEYAKFNDPTRYTQTIRKTHFAEENERPQWQDIIDNMYYPTHHTKGIFLQQDGFMDKQQTLVADLPKDQRPLNQNWSWDRILRSVFIKQADVLQGLYFFEDEFDTETIRRNFDFYEPRTVHESSLSPCVHAILASTLGYHQKAYEMYLQTARLDLDNYNNDTQDGLHITSMAGTWLAVVKGFGGMRIQQNQLHLNPTCPDQWQAYSFKINFRDHLLKINVSKTQIEIYNQSKTSLTIRVFGNEVTIDAKSKKIV